MELQYVSRPTETAGPLIILDVENVVILTNKIITIESVKYVFLFYFPYFENVLVRH